MPVHLVGEKKQKTTTFTVLRDRPELPRSVSSLQPHAMLAVYNAKRPSAKLDNSARRSETFRLVRE